MILVNIKYIIYIVPFHRFFITSKVLYNCKYHPSLGHSLYHSFVRRGHLLRDQLPGVNTGLKAAISWLPNWHGDPIQNAHILPLAITARYQFYTLVRWGRHGVHILPKDVTWSVNWQHWDSNPWQVHSESHMLSIWPPHLHVSFCFTNTLLHK